MLLLLLVIDMEELRLVTHVLALDLPYQSHSCQPVPYRICRGLRPDKHSEGCSVEDVNQRSHQVTVPGRIVRVDVRGRVQGSTFSHISLLESDSIEEGCPTKALLVVSSHLLGELELVLSILDARSSAANVECCRVDARSQPVPDIEEGGLLTQPVEFVLLTLTESGKDRPE